MAPSFDGWPLKALCIALALLLSASLSPASASFHPKRYNHQRSDYGLLRDHRGLKLSVLKKVSIAPNDNDDANEIRTCMLYKYCGPKNGEMIELNPNNDPDLKNVIDFANKDEKCKKRMEKLNLVPNSRNLYKAEDASKMAAFLYSSNYSPDGRQFYIHFNNFTRNFADVKGYPYCNFYTVLFNLKRTSQLNFSEDPRVKYIEGGRRLEMKLDNIVLFRGCTTDYLKKKVGATFQFKQFTSFSSDLATATVFAFDGLPNEASPTIFMIQNKYVPARSIQEYSIHHSESEYLIDPISKFQIVRVFQNARLEKKNFEKNFTTVYVIKYVNNPCNKTINGVVSEREG